MTYLGRSRPGVFASKHIGAHLMRGALAAGAGTWAIAHQQSEPWLSLAAGIAALVALRGCPVCWIVGLIETVTQRSRRPIHTQKLGPGSDRPQDATAA